MIVTLIALDIGYGIWRRVQRKDHLRAVQLEETRTHNRLLENTNILEGEAARSFARLRPLSDTSEDYVGFVYMPSFRPWYAASLRLPHGASSGEGWVISLSHDDQTGVLTALKAQLFHVPLVDYIKVDSQVANLTNQWRGTNDETCLDGVPVAFERVQHTYVTSGVGNASCDRHYAALDEIMKAMLRRFSLHEPS